MNLIDEEARGGRAFKPRPILSHRSRVVSDMKADVEIGIRAPADTAEARRNERSHPWVHVPTRTKILKQHRF